MLRGIDLQAMLFANAPVWIAVGAAYALWRKERIQVAGATLGYAAGLGVFICGVVNFLMLAAARGEASVIVPIAHMSFLVAPLISALLGWNGSPRKLAAVALAVGAIVVLARL